METVPDRGISHLATINGQALKVLTAVTEAQLDGHLAGDMIAVRQAVEAIDGTEFSIIFYLLEANGLVETEVWPGGWKVWATRHGWATVVEAERDGR